MTTITQTITSLPTAPNPVTQTPDAFDAAAAAFVAALPGMVTEENTWASQANTVAGEVNTNAATATTKASEASASASASASSAATAAGIAAFAGEWSTLSGAKTVPLSVSHEGAFWILLEAVADVTAEEPGVSSSWGRAFGSGQVYARTSNVEMTAEDNGKIIEITSGTFSQTFDACATLGANWSCYFLNTGTGVVTFDPDASELIDGAATKVLLKNTVTLVLCDGSALSTIEFVTPVGESGIWVASGNGHGSTNSVIRRFTNTVDSNGSDITYTDSASDGASFTINTAGIYSITYMDYRASTTYGYGVSLNSAELTTSIVSITASTRLMQTKADGNLGLYAPISITRYFAAGDVIRAHTEGTVDATQAAYSYFSIYKVGV